MMPRISGFIPQKDTMFDAVKNIGICITVIVALWGGVKAAGLNPITQSAAEDMIEEAVKEERTIFSNKILQMEGKIDEQNRGIVQLQGSFERIDERTLHNQNTSQQILIELRELRRNINQP